MKIDGTGSSVPAKWTNSQEFRSPATARAYERLAADLESSADPAVREELSSALGELRVKIAEVSASDPRPYGRSVEHEIKQMLIRSRQGGLPEETVSQPAPVPLPAPDPSSPTPVELPVTVETTPAPATCLNVLR